MTTETMSLSEIRRKHRDGVAIGILADLNGCSPIEIKNILKGGEINMKETNRDKWLEWYKQGLTVAEIAKKANAACQTIYNWHYANKLEINKKQRPVKHKTIVKPDVPKPEQVVTPVKVEEPLKPWVKDSDEKEMEKTSTRDIKGKLDPAGSEVRSDEAVQNILNRHEEDDSVKQGVTPSAPPYREEWQKYRTAQLGEWIAHCASRLMPIDPEFLQEYCEVVT